MGAVTKFEELMAWQRARTLTRLIYEVTNEGPISKDYGLKDQIQRAAVSVMSNIAEGFGYNSDNQFLRFLSISRASACEVQSLLYVALDAGYIDNEAKEKITSLNNKTISLIAALQRHLRK